MDTNLTGLSERGWRDVRGRREIAAGVPGADDRAESGDAHRSTDSGKPSAPTERRWTQEKCGGYARCAAARAAVPEPESRVRNSFRINFPAGCGMAR